ncbi:DUF58 domain-containing protein [Lapillicoccus sp.]|uniref:DUF58 domain-containing protein n=1 Tax=Lapillicoccus sp. TaxID=1909287 RepID=UPI003264AF64
MTALLSPVKSKLFIVAHRRSWGLLDGEYASVFRGRSLDYDDLREYVPGDEVRDIDWKATARHGSPLVKRWVATRTQTVVFVVDSGRGMAALAAGGEPKSVVGINVVGTLGYLALRHGDLVGLVEGDATATRPYAAKGREGHLERLLRAIAARTTLDSGPSRLSAQLEHVASHYAGRLLLVVVADERDLDGDDVVLVRRLHAQHEVLWVTVEDADPTAVGAGRRGVGARDVGDELVMAPEVRFDEQLHAAYTASMTARRASLASTLEGLGIVHGRVGASEQVLSVVFRMLERQRRRGR